MRQAGVPVPYLRAWRNSRVLTQKELAARAGMDSAIVSRIERGNNASVQTVRRLAKALGISATRLAGQGPEVESAGRLRNTKQSDR